MTRLNAMEYKKWNKSVCLYRMRDRLKWEKYFALRKESENSKILNEKIKNIKRLWINR